MKILTIILFLPVILTANIIGVLSAIIHVGVVNGYATAFEFMEKVQDK